MVSTAVSNNSSGLLFWMGRNQASDCIKGTTNLEKRDGELIHLFKMFLFKKSTSFRFFSSNTAHPVNRLGLYLLNISYPSWPLPR